MKTPNIHLSHEKTVKAQSMTAQARGNFQQENLTQDQLLNPQNARVRLETQRESRDTADRR
jgi:hypothetical protein